MNPYTLIGSGLGTAEAASLSQRLAAWHDAMVAHERRLRTGRTADTCDEECPHAEARTLWAEALATFGTRASELTLLRSRAIDLSPQSEELIAPTDVVSEAADTAHGSSRPAHDVGPPRSRSFMGLSDRSRTATAEL